MFFQGREHLTSQEKRKRGTQVPSDINAWERNSSKDVLLCSDNWGDSHSWIRSVAPGLASVSVPALWRVGRVWCKGAVLTGQNHCDWGLSAYGLSPGTVCLQCIALPIVVAVCCCLQSSGACSGVRWESWGQCQSLALTLTCTVLIFPDVSRNVTARSIWEDCILLNFCLNTCHFRKPCPLWECFCVWVTYTACLIQFALIAVCLWGFFRPLIASLCLLGFTGL